MEHAADVCESILPPRVETFSELPAADEDHRASTLTLHTFYMYEFNNGALHRNLKNI